MPRGKCTLLRVAPVLRSRRDGRVTQSPQLPVTACAQSNPLFRNRAPAYGSEYALARERKFHGPPYRFGCRGAKRSVVPQSSLSAEATTYEWRDHSDLLRLKAEDQCQRCCRRVDRLGGLQDLQTAVVSPHRESRVRFDGVVVIASGAIDVVDPDI